MSENRGNNFTPDRNEVRRTTSVSESSEQASDSYLLIPYGFQPKACHKPKAKSKEITGVTYNSRSKQFIILDSKGVTAWSHNSVINSVLRLLDYPSYQFNLIRLLLHCKKFNVYFGLSKDYALKVFNLNFHEVFSVISDMNSVLCMVFNSVTDELITGGTGGLRFWTFGEIQSDERSLSRDSRPMANYGLILRREHPAMGGTMIKDIILDERNQRLYSLSERNVVTYDVKGNFLFELKSAHQGQVTGCVYSKYSNFVVTAGTDCAVNVWSSNGGCLHSFYSHSKMVTNLLLHPEAPSLVITSSQDGTLKIFSLDIMEEIYSQVVFSEGIEWMNFLSTDIFYCATNKALQVFSINHVTNFWTTVRCPLRSMSLTVSSQGSRQNVLAIAEDQSARFLSKDGRLLSTVLPPPLVTTSQRSRECSAHAYCPSYGLVYLLVNQEEIWVYYTKSNPANRVEVWKLSDIRDVSRINCNDKPFTPSSERPRTVTPYERASSRTPSSPYPSNLPVKIVDGVPCLSLAFLNSAVNLKTKAGEAHPDLPCYLVAGLQDGRLLFTSPFSASVLYFQYQASKGAVVSIQHEVSANLLLLNTITLNKYTVQIRSLPDLETKHQVDAGSDLTCFVRMGGSLLTGHESGRLNLHRLISVQVTCDTNPKETFEGQKVTKDHLDSVLSVDANNNLQLYCSSSKDGCLKIWNNAKVLLREIVMDKTLTMACFLNSCGDLLVGFKNHIFTISHEKAHLTSYSSRTISKRNSEEFETGSDIYEDPRVRFEYKKTLPPEPVRMETYLVPFANISINLARLLTGQLRQSSFEDDVESENDGTESELSDAFSVAPTEIYASQYGTPLARSRSSSLASSWNLPNIGSSPVSSPPRTPPPYMSPVLELESEDDITSADNATSKNDRDTNVANGEEQQKIEAPKKTVKATPIFTRPKRVGLSERKVDSRALQSKVNLTKNADNLRNKRGKNEDTTNSSGPSQQGSNSNSSIRQTRSVVKKTKKQGEKSRKRTANSEQPSSENNTADNLEKAQGDSKRKNSEGNEKSTEDKTEVEGCLIGENRSGDENKENVTSNGAESLKHGNATSDTMLGQGYILSEKHADKLRVEREEVKESTLKENFVVKDIVEPKKDDLPIITTNGSPTVLEEDEKSEWSQGQERGFDEASDKGEAAIDCPSPRTMSREDFLSNSMENFDRHESLQFPDSDDDRHENLECEGSSDENMVVLDEREDASLGLYGDISDTTSEKTNKLTSKSVSFVVTDGSEEFKPRAIIPPKSRPKLKTRPGRRSVSPINVTSKVVPVMDSPPNGDTRGQRLHPNSALKIYALAKSRQRSPSGQYLISRPREKQRSFVKHNTSEISILEDTDRGRDRIPNNSDPDKQGGEVITETVKDNERHVRKEARDLMSWCMNALSEKSKYPIFSPRPRLRSRRSLLKDKDKSTIALVTKTSDSNNDSQDGEQDISVEKGNERRIKPREQVVIHLGNRFKEQHETGGVIEEMFDSARPSRSLEANAVDYSEGWQERLLEKARELKGKHLERKRKVLEKLEAERRTLEEKRYEVERYGSTRMHKDKYEGIDMDNYGSLWINMDNGRESPRIHDDITNKTQRIFVDKDESRTINLGGFQRTRLDDGYVSLETSRDTDFERINIVKRHRSRGINRDKSGSSRGINMDNEGYSDMRSDGKDLNRVKSSYVDFKNNPVIIQPYRLEKFASAKDEISHHGLNVDLDATELPDHLSELIPRPKSAPSIPSKCRKYVLVDSKSGSSRDKPEPTALEEMLMLQRFKKLNLKPRSSSNFPQVLQIRRPHSLQKIQRANVSCE